MQTKCRRPHHREFERRQGKGRLQGVFGVPPGSLEDRMGQFNQSNQAAASRRR